MSTGSPHPPRRQLSASDLARAQRIVDLAWEDLPAAHRGLLETIGADQRKAVDRPLGQELADLRRSAGARELADPERRKLDRAFGVWVADLRLILVDAGHAAYVGLDDTSYEGALAQTAWHEWGHALSVDRSTSSDVAAGTRLLGLAPPGIAEIVRGADYRSRDWTHELVAQTYALLMVRRRSGQTGQPPWLNDEIWSLMKRVAGWEA